jgi:hypothetical protein
MMRLCNHYFLLILVKSKIIKKIDSVFKISGAIGKQFVFKQYKDGQVVTKFPDRSGIIASASQRNCRKLFKKQLHSQEPLITILKSKKHSLEKLPKIKVIRFFFCLKPGYLSPVHKTSF